MKLIVQIKLKPNNEQTEYLLSTIKEANRLCNKLSENAFNNRCFNKIKLHYANYHTVKNSFKLSSQMIVRCFGKVAYSYKINRKKQSIFKELGSITYDSRILSYNVPKQIASIWSINGRLKIPFVCYPPQYLPYIKGEGDLVYKKGKFYIFQTCEVPEDDIKDVEDFIGVDFGLVEIAATSEGQKYSSKKLNDYREKRQKIRDSIQSKGTRNCKKLLKRLSGKERITSRIINHTISKSIVTLAEKSNKGIALENLKGIRFTADKIGKKHRTRLGKWSFYQLKEMIKYKANRIGIPVVEINPAYTSQTCSNCFHIGKRNGKIFKCENCKEIFDADVNAAKNISLLGRLVSTPERCGTFSCSICADV
jgi:IS605 OrfB family transposase